MRTGFDRPHTKTYTHTSRGSSCPLASCLIKIAYNMSRGSPASGLPSSSYRNVALLVRSVSHISIIYAANGTASSEQRLSNICVRVVLDLRVSSVIFLMAVNAKKGRWPIKYNQISWFGVSRVLVISLVVLLSTLAQGAKKIRRSVSSVNPLHIIRFRLIP
jgi:hypothetical protein